MVYDTTTPEGRKKRLEQIEKENIDRLMRIWKRKRQLAIANILMAVYGVDGDFDISPDGLINRG